MFSQSFLSQFQVPVFPLFLIILCGMGVFTILLRRSNRRDNSDEQAFWDRENEANATRAVDLSTLDYLDVPVEFFPFHVCDDEELSACEQTLTALSKEKILNLNGLTNTEVKLRYGAANLEYLSACDDRYTQLIQTISRLGTRLNELGFTEEAISVLEYGIGWGTDIKQNYVLLGELYCATGAFDQVDELKSTAESLTSLNKSAILRELSEL